MSGGHPQEQVRRASPHSGEGYADIELLIDFLKTHE